MAEQQTRKGLPADLGQNELLAQRRHRGEIAAGQLVEKSDAAAVLVAKLGDPQSQCEGPGVEHRQQAVNISNDELRRVRLRVGIQMAGGRVEDGGLMS